MVTFCIGDMQPDIAITPILKKVAEHCNEHYCDKMSGPLNILEYRNCSTDQFLNHARVLFREYEEFLNVDLCFQNYEEEMANLPGKYAAPDGCLILAYDGASPAACIAVRPLQDGHCEMKRLFVRHAYRGNGLGRELALRSIHFARVAGYSHMVLDTLKRLSPAVGLYRSLGFHEVPAYYQNPLEDVIYLSLTLINS